MNFAPDYDAVLALLLCSELYKSRLSNNIEEFIARTSTRSKLNQLCPLRRVLH